MNENVNEATVTEEVTNESTEHCGGGDAQEGADGAGDPAASADASPHDPVDPFGETDETSDPCGEDGSDGGGVRGSEEIRREALRAAREELLEFRSLYPEVDPDGIPESVRASALPLAAAYALYERRERRLLERAAAENQRNSERSAGGMTLCDEPFYSPDEVRKMTRDEIRANYDAVLRSMKRWG